MKIGIFAGSNSVPIHARSLEERPLGGTETGIILVAEELQQLGHEVTVFSGPASLPRPDPVSPNAPRYVPLEAVESTSPLDVFITVRDWIPLFYKVQSRQRYLWTGDSYDQLANLGIGDRRIYERMNGILAVSEWQANVLAEKSGFPREKIFVIRNGIRPELFTRASSDRPAAQMIYSSTPYRGLEHVPNLLLRVRTQVPDVTVQVFSGYTVYDQPDTAFEPLRAHLSKTPGVILNGNVPQAKLAEAFCQSRILFYPNQFEETSCITAIEAMAAGCVPVTSKLGALPETIGDAGICIDGQPRDPLYQDAFVEATTRLLKDPALWKSFSEKGQARAKELTWRKTAERLLALIQSL